MAEQQRYRVIKRLAAGGMAEVFVAESAGIEGFKKQVAIKRVLPALSKKEQFIAMFLDEARLSGHLSHCNVVSVFDIGVGDGTYFIVMEYVDGADLKNVMEWRADIGEKMPVEAAVFIATKICQGLAYAHELTTADGKPLRIVHRDITPANVLMTRYGEIKIVDFGLARASSQLAESDAGMIKGKYGYLAPETVMEIPVDHRVDIFSVGIILWEMLAGQRLFLGRTEYETVKLVHAAAVPRLQAYNPLVPVELEWILARALARDPNARYHSAGHFGRDLTSFLYRYGRPVSEYEVADLVRSTLGFQSQAHVEDGLQKISQYIDLMALEFKSLTNDSEGAPLSVVQPESVDWRARSDDQPLGGLAEALEGPEPEIMDLEPDPPEDQQPAAGAGAGAGAGVAGWFRGLIR
jgi:eukaryotic-like serine/threonine-protein kinase